ncbi:hypothetical protein SAMN05660649_04670 [Desulfotomaculum arcticum]|uniref:Uncharacterized protein n=1 Tax=Desulfotruncus arcticus DSM 17038 TaxID=1121424 RepID=A0A1I2YY07_9FIRM|nr:hypothetical protein [Desulfotruncus arcticus]SFH30159.1 hypothetical protein SAMN05660649_04670 [Desulfotomaculum arcticum] [Desulfotruncus arcticus DSM 17038]
MAIYPQNDFLNTFNQEWCWKVVRLVHLNEVGAVRDFLTVIGRLEIGRRDDADFTRVTEESQVPGRDYLYLQTVIKSSKGKPAYTRIFIDTDNDLVFDIRPDRVLILNGREVVGFFNAGQEMGTEFLSLENCSKAVGRLCDRLGKKRSEVGLLT